MNAIHDFRLSVICTFLIAVPVFAQEPPAGAEAQELQRLAGQWRFETVEVDDEPREPDANSAKLPLVIRRKEMTHGENRVTFSIDAGTDPKVIDVVLGNEEAQARTFEGIYKLKDNTLTFCLNLDDTIKQRPSEFATTPGSKLIVLTFTRIELP